MEKNITLKITGMHCTSCEKIIFEELSDLPGVSDISVSSEKGGATLILNEAKNNKEDVLGAIKKAGYEAVIIESLPVPANKPHPKALMSEPDLFLKSKKEKDVIGSDLNQRLNLSLFGMHCSSCANIIERALKKVPGFKRASVNFAAEKVSIFFDQSLASSEVLIDAIRKTGYRAELIDTRDTDYECRKRENEITSYFNKFWLSFALSLPMLYFMLLDFFSIPGKTMILPYVGIISLIFTMILCGLRQHKNFY